jgi:hypothetical protein
MKGKQGFQKGHGKYRTKESYKKQSKIMKGNKNGFKKGKSPWNKGLKKRLNTGKTHFKKGKKGFWFEKKRPNMVGENHPSWKGGTSPYTTDWTNTLKRSIRERDNYTCQLCGKLQGDTAFHVHHIDYDKKNCNPINLITLCKSCHTKTNFKREYWINYFSTIYGG